MAQAAGQVLGSRIVHGLVAAPEPGPVPAPFRLVTAEHPQPGPGSEEAGRLALGLAGSVPSVSRLLVLLSGGASALLAAPVDGVTLAEKREATRVLLRAGADIRALNTVRKHLSALKGGRLAAACAGECLALILSDVVGDDPSIIASGPTVADVSTFADALAVLESFGGVDAFPLPVVAHLRAGVRGEREESPKPGDTRLSRANTVVLGTRHTAMQGAAREAERRGYAVSILQDPVVGEARVAGPQLVGRLLERAAGLPRPACLISSGETTVRVTGSGRGGRNQELAVAAAETIARGQRAGVLASIGTDGVDGPTNAAGAIVDATSVVRSGGWGAMKASLANNDVYPLLASTGDLVRLGPTGTNVGDLQVFLLA